MSNTYVVLRDIFYLNPKDVIRVKAREKTPDGNAIVTTLGRGMDNIQFPLPYEILDNTKYFVAIHDDLFKEQL